MGTQECITSFDLPFYFRDACNNNSDDAVIHFTVEDDIIPEISNLPAGDLTHECDAIDVATMESFLTQNDPGSTWSADSVNFIAHMYQTIPELSQIVLSDNCTSDPSYAFSYVITQLNDCPNLMQVDITLIAIDDAGNESDPASITIIFQDTTPPVLTAPAAVSYQCVEDMPAAGMLPWTDTCTGSGEVQGTDMSDGGNCPEIITRTWSYSDGCNTTTVTQLITIHDTTAPTLVGVPADETVQCSSIPVAATVTATDNCIAPLSSITFTETSTIDVNPCDYTITRTWSVSDNCNTTTAIQILTVIDTEAPVFEYFENPVMVECLEDVLPILDLTAEDCGNTIDATGFGSNVGEVVSSCELSDAVGGFATWSLWLPVLFEDDSLVSSANFIWDANGGLFECYADGTARLTGTVVNDVNMAESFDLDFWFENQADWATWSANIPARSYKDDLDCAEPTGLFEAWDYYEMVGGISHAIGQGDLAGSTLSFYHDPASFYFGFQVGDGANNTVGYHKEHRNYLCNEVNISNSDKYKSNSAGNDS